MEAIEMMEQQRPQKALKYSKELEKSAKDHSTDCQENDSIKPIGSDGSFPNERIGRYCSYGATWGESILVGATTAKHIAELLVVSDGIPSWGNRKNLFHKDINFIGVSICPHPSHGTICVIDFGEKIGAVGAQLDI